MLLYPSWFHLSCPVRTGGCRRIGFAGTGVISAGRGGRARQTVLRNCRKQSSANQSDQRNGQRHGCEKGSHHSHFGTYMTFYGESTDQKDSLGAAGLRL